MIKVFCIDCIDGLQQIKPSTVDCIVTSPPYNMGIKYDCDYDDKMPRPDYLDWMGDVAKGMHHALSDNGSIFLNVGSRPTDPTIPYDVLAVMLKHFKLQNTFHWVKSIFINDKSYGHYKPINSPRFVNDCHEFIFHLTKSGTVTLDRLAVGVPYTDKSNISRWSGKADLKCRGNTWFIPYETVRSEKAHPAAFPVELAEMCFKVHGVDWINKACDPFVGIGSSAIAAHKLGIQSFIGMDLSQSYIDIAQERLDTQ